jgi:hypothetical protein
MPDETGKKQFIIQVLPEVKERLDRISKYYYHHPQSRIVEGLGPSMERGLLARLTPQQQKLYMRGKLSPKEVFGRDPYRERIERLRGGSRKAAVARVAVSVVISDESKKALQRYCKFWGFYSAYVLHLYSRRVEKDILTRLSREQQKEFLAGKFERTPPITDIVADDISGEDDES